MRVVAEGFGRVTVGRERHDRRGRATQTLLQFARELGSVHAGHVNIGQDEVRLFLEGGLESVCSIHGQENLEAGDLESESDHLACMAFVIDHQNTRWGRASFNMHDSIS